MKIPLPVIIFVSGVLGVMAFAVAAVVAAPLRPSMSWGQDFRPEGIPLTVRVDRYPTGTRLVLSAGPGDRTPEHQGCDLLRSLGLPHSTMADAAIAGPVSERVIDQRYRLRKALGWPSDRVR